MDIIEQIVNYQPFNEQEEKDKEQILKLIKCHKDIFHRENKNAHMTASSWIVNDNKSKVLMAHHNIYNSWAWLGGHADGESDLLGVAEKEIMEESGLSQVTPISNDIFSLEILTVDGHRKNGEYVSSHLHLNITYLFQSDERTPLTIKPDENSGVAWFNLDEAIKVVSEPWYKKHIYTKLNTKLRSHLNND